MTEPVRVGIVGAGPWANLFHGPMFAAGPETMVAGVWARRSEPAAALAAKLRAPAFEDYDALLAACDAVVFSLPPDIQPEFAARAAAARKALLLEKPIADTLVQAEALAAAVNRAGVPSMVMLTYRFAVPVLAFLEEARAFDAFGGRVTFISSGLREGIFAFGWRLERGALLDLGPHVLDLAQGAFGPITNLKAHGDPLKWVGLLLDHEGGKRSEIAISGTTNIGSRAKVEIELYGPGGVKTFDAAAAMGGPGVQSRIRQDLAAMVRTRQPHAIDVNYALILQRWIAEAEKQLQV